MLMHLHSTAGVSVQSMETALSLSGMALMHHDLPQYLLAPEVAVLLSCFDGDSGRSEAGRSASVHEVVHSEAA